MTEGVTTRRGQAGIVLLATETPSNFLLFLAVVVVFSLAGFGPPVVLVIVVVAGPMAWARWKIVFRATLDIIDGLRPLRRGSPRGGFMIRPGVSLAPAEGAR